MSLAVESAAMKILPLAAIAGAFLFAGLPAVAGSVLERIKARGKIVVAHRASSVPFSYVDTDQKAIGYAVDLCGHVAEAVRKSLRLKALLIEHLMVSPGDRIAAVSDGRADLECGSTTNNAERRQKVAFTVPHYIAARVSWSALTRPLTRWPASLARNWCPPRERHRLRPLTPPTANG